MSTYTSKKARLRATLTAQVKSYLATECHALLNEIIGGTSSTALAESSARLASSRAETLRDLETLATTELARLPLAALPSPLAAEFEGFTADLGRAAALPAPERLRFTESAAPRLAELVGRAGAEFGKVERLATAEALAAKKLAACRDLPPATRRRRTLSHLLRKGYPLELSTEIIDILEKS